MVEATQHRFGIKGETSSKDKISVNIRTLEIGERILVGDFFKNQWDNNFTTLEKVKRFGANSRISDFHVTHYRIESITG